MNRIIAWFESRNITSHTVAAVAISAATLISTDEQVRSFLVSAFQQHPKIASELIALAGIILKYSRSSSPAGAVTNVVTDAVIDPKAAIAVTATKAPE
jgi:pantothenate kinase type III